MTAIKASTFDGFPDAFYHYFLMWNERDKNAIRAHLDKSVSEDCLWVDPQNYHQGRDALEQNVIAFRELFPDADLTLGSNIDGHHQRYRYEWLIKQRGELVIRGFDLMTVNDDGLIERVDGFFNALERID